MPGSDGGDRVHNFFGQEKFSNRRSQQQVVDGSGLVSNGFHWHGNQRHESLPLNFSPGHTASDPGIGYLDRQPDLVHTSPYLQSPQRQTLIASPHLVQHTSLNGYIHDHGPAQTNHDETDFMGMNRESNQQNPFSRGLLNPGAQFGNVPEQHHDGSLEATDTPINFDFLGNHQQMNTQQLGMLQSSQRQHSGLNERQLLQQQAMLRNLHDVQRQQQLQKQDIRQINSVNNLSIGQKMPNNRHPSLNITSFQDESNYARMSQHRADNSNRLQGVISPVMQGISNGISFSSEQSAPPHSFGVSPQSVDHSPYRIPISNTRGPSSHHSRNMGKPMPPLQQVPTGSIPLPANNYGTLPGQVNAQDVDGFRYGFSKNNNHHNNSSQVSYPGVIMGNLPQVQSQQRNPYLEFPRTLRVLGSNSKENISSHTCILQDAAPLDPTEEQFLFGSDDNIWNAFGKSSNSKLEDNKMAEGPEFKNQFPSMQRGSWTALMQSALAESCSGDTGNKEEWSELNLRGKPAGADHEQITFSSIEKQRTTFNNCNLQIKPSLDTSHYTSLEKAGATNSDSLQGPPLSSFSSSSAVNERFQSNLNRQVSGGNQQVSGGNWHLEPSNLKAHPEENQIRSEYGHHIAATLNSKGPLGACDPQLGTSFNTVGNQANNKSGYVTNMGSICSNGYGEQKRFMHEEMQKDKSAWTQYSFSNSPSPRGQVNSNSHVATGYTINSLRDNQNGTQSSPVSYAFNYWKPVGSISERGSEIMETSKHPSEARLHVFDSSFNNHDKKIQQQANFRDNTSRNSLQDAFMLSQSNPNVEDMKQKVSNQVAGNPPGVTKYQYHSSGQEPKSSSQNDKGKRSNSHTDMHELHETSSVGLSMHHLANKTFQSSQNVGELSNNAGRSRENNANASRNSSERNVLSEKRPEESLDTSISHLHQNHSLASHTNGLQLGPPQQKFATQVCVSSQALSSQDLNSGQFLLHPPAVSQVELHDARSGFWGQGSDSVSLHIVQEHSNVSDVPPNNQLQYQSREGDMSSYPFMFADAVVSQLDHTDKIMVKAPIMPSSVGTQFNALGGNKHSINLPSSSYQPNVRPKDLSFTSAWENVPNQQDSSQPDIFASQSHMKASVIPVKTDELNVIIGGNDSPGSGASNTALGEDPRVISSSRKSGLHDDTSLEQKEPKIPGKGGFPFSDTITLAEPEISANSVKSDGKLLNSYSLLNQFQFMRSTEINPNNRDSKRLKVQSSCSDSQQSPSRSGQHQSSYSPNAPEIVNHNSAASGDSKLGNFISVPSYNRGGFFPSQHGNAPFQNTPTFGQNGNPALSSMLLSQISPQMAPTWFEQYGSLSREQLVPASDVWKHSLSRPLELGQTPQNSSIGFLAKNHVSTIPALSFAKEVGDMKYCSAPEHIMVEQSTSLQPTSVLYPSFGSVVPNKLITATLELLPWSKEVQWRGLRDLLSISASEVKWANATKRIPEVMDEVEQADNRTVKCKRRLVFTTQLMQQLLDPPSPSVMSSDAYMNYESVVYFTSRVSYGSACSLSSSEIYRCMSSDHNNRLYKKVDEQGDDLLSKIKNDFLVRASKLENTLSSLENQTSIHDLQIDWQDLEKFSVINRFARFHGRGQADGSVILNSAMNPQSHGPQRYVTALPFSPTNLLSDNSVQCLSL